MRLACRRQCHSGQAPIFAPASLWVHSRQRLQPPRL